MKVHSRHIPCVDAERKLREFLHAWEEVHQLTPAEYLFMLNGAVTDRIGQHLRGERAEEDNSKEWPLATE